MKCFALALAFFSSSVMASPICNLYLSFDVIKGMVNVRPSKVKLSDTFLPGRYESCVETVMELLSDITTTRVGDESLPTRVIYEGDLKDFDFNKVFSVAIQRDLQISILPGNKGFTAIYGDFTHSLEK